MAFWDRWRQSEETEGGWRDYDRGSGERDDWRYQRGYYGQGSDYDDWRYRRGYDQGINYGRSGQYDEERYRRGYSGQQSDYQGWGYRGSDYSRDREGGQGAYHPSRAFSEYWDIPGPYTGRGPQGYQRSDERIREDIGERLTRHGYIDAHNIEVDVRNCEVTLKGVVGSRHAKRMAEDVAESVWGVHDVHNQLRVKQQEESQQGQTNGSRRRTSQGTTS
jgi:osmotically-inducible protein OsmY